MNNLKIEKQLHAAVWIGKTENSSIGNTFLSFAGETLWSKIENSDGTQIMIRPLQSNDQIVIMYETTMGYQNEDCDDEQALILDSQPDSDSESFEFTEFDTTDICDPTAVWTNDIPIRICFDVSPSTFKGWIADWQVTISLGPITTAINPGLCSANRACIELITPNTRNTEEFETNALNIKVYPNPVSSVLEVSSKEKVEQLLLYNLNGQVVKKVENDNSIEVSELSVGIYLLKLTIAGSTFTKKIIEK